MQLSLMLYASFEEVSFFPPTASPRVALKAFLRLGAPYGHLSVFDSQSGDRKYLKVLCCTSLYRNP